MARHSVIILNGVPHSKIIPNAIFEFIKKQDRATIGLVMADIIKCSAQRVATHLTSTATMLNSLML